MIQSKGKKKKRKKTVEEKKHLQTLHVENERTKPCTSYLPKSLSMWGFPYLANGVVTESMFTESV